MKLTLRMVWLLEMQTPLEEATTLPARVGNFADSHHDRKAVSCEGGSQLHWR